jgi:uncharacterized membrane protein YkvA (DUF1232 family)
MLCVEHLKKRARALKKELTALYYAYKNPKTGPLPKIIVLFTVGYALSPIDLIPDFIPVLGLLDDLIILPAMITLSIRLIPPVIMQESRFRAEAEPIKLRKNWVFAVLFILVWISILTIITLSLISGIRQAAARG